MIFVMCAIVGAGLVLTAIQGILHAPEFIAAYLTRVEHPLKPNFDQYDALLAKIARRNRVDYCAARNSANMDKALKQFAETSCDEFASDSDKLCYWINAYNLFVVKTIADRFPIKSVETISNDLNSHLYTAGGVPISCKDIRQLKIQPLLGGTQNGDCTDARMLLLICGGAMGYPTLLDHAITSESLGRDMGENTFRFIRVRYNVYYDVPSHTMFISPFFQWNQALFMKSFPDPFDFVIYYLYEQEKPDPQDIHFKKNYNKKFDWRVNDVSTPD